MMVALNYTESSSRAGSTGLIGGLANSAAIALFIFSPKVRKFQGAYWHIAVLYFSVTWIWMMNKEIQMTIQRSSSWAINFPNLGIVSSKIICQKDQELIKN